jgi:pentatricopeptide repeat protein
MLPTSRRILPLAAALPNKVSKRQQLFVAAAFQCEQSFRCLHANDDDDDDADAPRRPSGRRRRRGLEDLLAHSSPPLVVVLRRFSTATKPITPSGPHALASEHYSSLSPLLSSSSDGGSSNSPPSSSAAAVTAASGDSTVSSLLNDLERAAKWNHGMEGKYYDKSLWDIDFCQKTAGAYDSFLNRLLSDEAAAAIKKDRPRFDSTDERLQLLSSETVTLAFKVLVKCHYEPDVLSIRVRDWERCLGKLKQTPLTDHLSLRLLTANGKAGNVGRVLSLLQLRKSQGYHAREREFVNAVTSLQVASLPQRRSRNIYLSDREQPAIDNPTRWLDAILLNMSDRDYRLTTRMANRMLNCYSATGRTGKAVHSFYRVTRHCVNGLPREEQPADCSAMPQDWFYVPGGNSSGGYSIQPIKVKLKYNLGAPPFYKVPAQVKGKLLYRADSAEGKLKLEREMEPEYSLPLAAAFAFAESLQHGACGHDGIKLNHGSYNALIKACVYRGALWRAMHVLDTTMPDAGCPPDAVSYNLVLSGLAAVGDIVKAQEYYVKMQNTGIQPDAYTVRAIVDGLLNMGDTPGAVTVVQDFFNQHSILPPYTTHTKILEFCLARDMVYEAKRYIYFLQQLWRWKPSSYDDEDFVKLMEATQKNTQLQKPALQKLFAYFGEELTDADFLP